MVTLVENSQLITLIKDLIVTVFKLKWISSTQDTFRGTFCLHKHGNERQYNYENYVREIGGSVCEMNIKLDLWINLCIQLSSNIIVFINV